MTSCYAKQQHIPGTHVCVLALWGYKLSKMGTFLAKKLKNPNHLLDTQTSQNSSGLVKLHKDLPQSFIQGV